MTNRATACPHCRNWHRYHSTFVCGWCYTRHLGAIVSQATYYTTTLPTTGKPDTTFKAELFRSIGR